MEKLKMESVNLTEQNIEKIGKLFPNVITEGKDENGKLKKSINFGLLQQVLSEDLVNGDECYEFTWVGKNQSIIEGNQPIRKTLRPCVEESKDWDKTENLYIEGDNLEVLKLLQNSYLNSIKMIYIDPPYNTGKDFVYRDNFNISKDDYEEELGLYDDEENRLFQNTESNGRFHSDWCSMMYPRLQLARNLLKQDGIIFISIDDNEVHNLKKICDEIFGSENAMFTYTIKVRYEGKTLVEDMLFQKVVENVLVYVKSKNDINLVRQQEDYTYDKFIYDIEESGEPQIIELGGKKVEIFQNNQYRVIEKEMDKSLLKEIWASGSILDGNSSGRFFRDYLTGRYREDGLGVLYKVYGIGGDDRPYRYFTGPKKEGATKGKYYQGVPSKINEDSNNAKKEKPIATFYDLAGDFGNCRNEGNMDFRSGKKPLALFKKLFEILPWEKNDIILDFFSGSASCAHAVMDFNSIDDKNLRFIMVQIPESCDEKSEAYNLGYMTICELGKERIRRSGDKIKKDKGLMGQNLDIGFRVLKLDDTNMKDVYYGSGEYTQQKLLELESNIKEDRTDLDLLYGVMLEWGVPLSLPHKQEKMGGKTVHFVNGSDLVACFDENINETVIRDIAKQKPLRVVFRDSSFSNSPDKINVTEIFKTISPETTIKVI